MLGVDAPHLYERGVIDSISHISLGREGNNPGTIREQLSELFISSFKFISQKIQGDKNISETERRLFYRGLRLRGQTANMLNSRTRKIHEIHNTLAGVPNYHEHDIKANFDALVK